MGMSPDRPTTYIKIEDLKILTKEATEAGCKKFDLKKVQDLKHLKHIFETLINSTKL